MPEVSAEQVLDTSKVMTRLVRTMISTVSARHNINVHVHNCLFIKKKVHICHSCLVMISDFGRIKWYFFYYSIFIH